MSLDKWGFNSFFHQLFDASRSVGEPARVIATHRGESTVATEGEIRNASPSGKLLYSGNPLPATGDWVIVRGGAIDAVLPRRTVFARKAAGSDSPQILAANIDVLFVVTGLDGDFNVRRLERYLVLARDSGADPVIVLNKADLSPDLDSAVEAATRVSGGAPVLTVSALQGEGIDAIESLLPPGRTGALIGSSGAGKSTIVNALTGDGVIATQPVRADDSRGRHTTTHRELIPLPSGGLLMDMPGLREVGLWADDASLDAAFSDVADAAANCRFRDCRHQGEPGCAVVNTIDPDRLASYRKLNRELEYLERRDDLGAQLAQKRQWKTIHKAMRRSKSLT